MEQILGPGGILARQLPSYEARPAQLTMARRVEECMRSESRLVVEAGTGTGKTLAYLAPAVRSGLKVVISTGTKTLQEQIFTRDIPMLLDMLELDLPVACMKGISNYLCLRRFNEARRAADLLVPDPHLLQLEEWIGRTRTGDRAELTDLPDDAFIWSEVSPTPETRLGRKCVHYDDCFVTMMKQDAAAARIVVVNHHLLLADLAVRSQHPEASVIPAYEALVLDEAHQLEDIATSFFGQSVSVDKIAVLAREIGRAAKVDQDRRGVQMAGQLGERGAELFHLLDRELPRITARSDAPGFPGQRDGRQRLTEEPLGAALQRPYFALDSSLEALVAHLEELAGGREELANLARRCAVLRDTLTLFAEPPAEGTIFWSDRPRRGPALHASPVEVGPIMQKTLFTDPIPMVFTSATMAAGGRGSSRPLEYFLGRIGLDGDGADLDMDAEVEELVLPSPFDFETQTLLYLAPDLPPPGSQPFIFRAAERMSQLIDMTAGRALVLFTSYRNLQAAAALLENQIRYPILCQGTRPRSVLLDQFRSQVSSVLLATASFWEGVDVVGESLSMVIIDKLPFAVPDDPLTAARIELLRERGQQPFQTYQLPQALLALRQGFGRLIRHREDRGVVALLDRRVCEKSYGKYLLDNLPPSPRTTDLLRVRAFCARMRLQETR